MQTGLQSRREMLLSQEKGSCIDNSTIVTCKEHPYCSAQGTVFSTDCRVLLMNMHHLSITRKASLHSSLP